MKSPKVSIEYVYGDMQICVHECMSSEVRRGLELELQVRMSYLTWVLENILESSARADHVLKH